MSQAGLRPVGKHVCSGVPKMGEGEVARILSGKVLHQLPPETPGGVTECLLEETSEPQHNSICNLRASSLKTTRIEDRRAAWTGCRQLLNLTRLMDSLVPKDPPRVFQPKGAPVACLRG